MPARLYLALLGLFSAFQLVAQIPETPQAYEHCGTEYLQQILDRDPEQRKALEQMEQIRYDALKNAPAPAKSGGAVYLVPVVFHLVHQNGVENIPDAQVLDALEYLNNAFSHTAYYAQAGDGADMQIQFCLAKRTPDGQASSGITRTESALTDVVISANDKELKDLIRWDPRSYVNVWVVRSILTEPQGMAYGGYAYLPHGHGSSRDGVVILAAAMGISPKFHTTLPHELGHYLGLYHTFQGGCPNNDCLLQGDRVCDTPPDQATFTACPFNSCSTDTHAPAPNPFTSDVNDMTENFMDYSPNSCKFRFTEGQGERMRFFLTGIRSSLLSTISCLPACDITISTEIIASTTSMQVGDTLFCTAQSQNAVQFEWYVDGFLWAQTPEFKAVGLSIGYHEIKHIVRNGTPNCLAVDLEYVTVSCNLQGGIQASATQLTPGASATFTAAVNQATQFKWKVNGQDAGADAVLNFIFPTLGNYLIELTASNVHCSQTYPLTVAVNAPCIPLAPPQWAFGYFSCDPEMLSSAVFPNGDLMLAGEDCGKSVIMRLRPDGMMSWSRQLNFTGNSRIIDNAVPTPDNGVIGLVSVRDSLIFNQDYLFKLDSLGNFIWSKKLKSFATKFYNYQYPIPKRLAVQSDGTILVFTSYIFQDNVDILAQFSPDGDLQWVRSFDVPENGGMTVARQGGGSYLQWANYSDTLPSPLMRFSESGQLLWQKEYRIGPSQERVQPILMLAEPDGGFSLLFFANYLYPYQLILVRCDDAGNIRWVRGYKSNQTAFQIEYVDGTFATKTSDGGYLISGHGTGYISGVSGFNTQLFIRLDSLGNSKWAVGTKYTTNSSAGILVDAMVKTGVEWQGSMALPVTVGHDEEIYLMRFNNNGYAGGCAETPVNISISNTIPVSIIETDFMPLPFDSLELISNTFGINNKNYFTKIECPQFPVCPENCSNASLDDDNDGYPDCYDPQCNCFTSPACIADSITGNIRAKLVWETPADEVLLGTVPMVANLNPATDQVPEIAVLQAPKPGSNTADNLLVFAGNGQNRLLPDRVLTFLNRVDTGGIMPQIGIANFFRNEHPAVFTGSFSSNFRGYSHYKPGSVSAPLTGWISGFGTGALNPTSRPHFADFDRDGLPEIYAGNEIIQLLQINTTVFRLSSIIKSDTTRPHGRLAYNNFQYRAANPVAAELLTRLNCGNSPDCDGLELAAGPVIYSVEFTGWDGDYRELRIQRDLNALDPGPAVWADGYTAVADINLDNIPEVVVASKRDAVHGVYAWNRNGLLRFFPYPENTPLSGGLPCIANVFDDRLAGFAVDYPEIIAASANRLTCFNLNAANANPNAPWWWSVATADPTGIIGVTAFDFDADGLSEIVFRDGAELRILYGGRAPFPPGVDAARNWFSMPAAGKVGDSYPVVADCDGDGQAEIIFTSYGANGPDSVGSLKGRLRVLKADTLAWPGCRNFWNQYGNIGPHIDNDLSIPIQQLEPQRSFAPGKRPFNRYGAQVQDLDADFNPYIRVADLNVQVDSSWCGSEKLFAQVRVCNSGALQLPDSVPIRFYRGNPTLTDAPAWGQVQYLPGPIEPGGCVQHIISIPVEKGQPYFGMLNDAGTTPRPFLPAGIFHAAKGLECNYADNLFQLSWTWDTPVLDLGPDQKLCTGNALPLDAGPDFSAYRWQDGSTEQFYTAAGPGTFWVDVWDVCGFRQTDTLHIAPDPNGQLNLGPDLTVCAGDTVMLSVAGFSSVVWSPADAVSCANCPQITLAPFFSLTLTATGTIGNCYATDSVRINVGLFLNVALSSTPSAAGQSSGTAVAAALGGTPPFKYLWNTGATSDSLSGLAPGLYSVIVTDALGCTIAGSVVVEQLVSTQDLEATPALWVQPNPASREFSIGVSLNQSAEARLYVINILGQNYWEKRLVARESRWEISCADWPAGLYQVVLESGVGRKVVPIVVAR